MDRFTVEEINLMCIYDTSSRTALINDLVSGLNDVYDLEMTAIFGSAIEKLEAITDEDFSGIGLYAADDDDDYDDDGEGV